MSVPLHPRIVAAGVLVLLAAASCGPPPPQALTDLPPCSALRRQVCGPQGQCDSVPSSSDDCLRCKSRLCRYVKVLEADNNQPVCMVEMRARPEYPICQAPPPLPTIPPPPVLVRVQCERECYPFPTPPEPPPPEDQF